MSLPPTYPLLRNHPNPTYLETGIWRADSLRQAIDAGFAQVIGIEYFEENINFCKGRFRMKSNAEIVGRVNVKLVHGDSALVLWDTIKDINTPITFFLDSHAQYLEGEVETENPYPLNRELGQIKVHPIKTHTIIIDDILHLTHPEIPCVSKEYLEYRLLQINPDYKLTYIANPVKNNILIATPQ